MAIESAIEKVKAFSGYFSAEFPDWLKSNYPIYEYFERSALQVISAGFKHYSARTIVEVMRHRTAIREIGTGEWKLNNNRTPELARLFMLLHPEHDGFFELRFQDKRAA